MAKKALELVGKRLLGVQDNSMPQKLSFVVGYRRPNSTLALGAVGEGHDRKGLLAGIRLLGVRAEVALGERVEGRREMERRRLLVAGTKQVALFLCCLQIRGRGGCDFGQAWAMHQYKPRLQQSR